MAAKLENDPNDQDQDVMPPASKGPEMPPAPPDPAAEALAEKDREIAKLQAAQKETNRKAAADRKFREDHERAEQEKKDAQVPELDRLKARAAEAERKLAEADRDRAATRASLVRVKVDRELERQAQILEFLYPDMVPALIDHDLIDFDEDAPERPLNARALVEALAKERPALVRAAQRAGTPPRPGGQGGGGRALAQGGNSGDESAPPAVNVHDELRRKVRYV